MSSVAAILTVLGCFLVSLVCQFIINGLTPEQHWKIFLIYFENHSSFRQTRRTLHFWLNCYLCISIIRISACGLLIILKSTTHKVASLVHMSSPLAKTKTLQSTVSGIQTCLLTFSWYQYCTHVVSARWCSICHTAPD